MGASTDLFDLAVEYLEACQAALTTTPQGAIGRAFVTYGVPAWDCCPQLTVHVAGPANPATLAGGGAVADQFRIARTHTVNLVTLVATVLRCVPTIQDVAELPSPTAMEAAAAETCSDVWAIWNHLQAMKRAGTLFAGSCREMSFNPPASLNPSGGCGGWEIQVVAELGGYSDVP